ncbi:hypothetical protein [Wolbachia endosymbiont of Cantharis cryptica]|uniref:hypothetical protein n=1 Tax=Wolbachia endosymbiont of Cantharis cryptica TaxID=3066132 RepID=UPI00376F1D38
MTTGTRRGRGFGMYEPSPLPGIQGRDCWSAYHQSQLVDKVGDTLMLIEIGNPPVTEKQPHEENVKTQLDNIEQSTGRQNRQRG